MLVKRFVLLTISCLVLSLSALAYPWPRHDRGGRDKNPVTMPEPSSMALAGMGLVGLVGAIRRKTRG